MVAFIDVPVRKPTKHHHLLDIHTIHDLPIKHDYKHVNFSSAQTEKRNEMVLQHLVSSQLVPRLSKVLAIGGQQQLADGAGHGSPKTRTEGPTK